MMMSLAFRNIFRHRTRSFITLSTIAFGCAALIFVGGFFDNIFSQMRTSLIQSQTGHLQIYKAGFTKYGKADPYEYFINDLPRVEKLIQELPEVDFVTGRIQFAGLLSTGETTVSFYGQGIDPKYERTQSTKDLVNIRTRYHRPDMGLPVVVEGEGLEENQNNQILMGKGLAMTMEARPGTNVTLVTNTVDGSTNARDMMIKGTFFTSVKSFDEMFLRVSLPTAQKLLNTDSVQSLVIYLKRIEDTGRMKQKIEKIFHDNHMNLEVKRWEEVTDFYKKTVELFDMFYLIMRLVVTMVVILSVFNTMNMAVMERISEIGTLMAIGIKRKGIKFLFLLEGIMLGAVGGACGLILGTIIVSIISFIGIEMPPAPGGTVPWLSEPTLVPHVFIKTFLLSVFIGALSSAFPAYKASRLVITQALRHR